MSTSPDLSSTQQVNTDYYVDPSTSDWVFANGDVVFAKVSAGNPGNPQGISQAVTTAVRTWVGEWFGDLTKGVDWRTIFTTKGLDDATIQAMIQARVLSVTGVTGVTSISLTRDRAGRSISVVLSYTTAYGPVFNQVVNTPVGIV